MRKLLTVVVVLVASMVVGLGNAAADARAIRTPASYKGRVIDLAHSWEGAKACAVVARGDIRCFDSEAEQWRELARLRRPSPATATMEFATYCVDRTDLWVVLYENTNFGGSSISVNEMGYWHELSSIGLDNMMSSWKNNTYCDATAATGAAGGGSLLTLTARSQSSDVGSTWNDVVSSVKLPIT